MVRCRTGRRDRIADPLDLEPGGKRGRGSGGHGLRHCEWADALRALATGHIGRFYNRARGRAARAHDDPRHLVRDFLRFETGIPNGLLHREMIPRRPAPQKAHGAAIDRFLRDKARSPVHLAPKPKLARTSWVVLPMDEMTPIPVTTTRLMKSSFAYSAARGPSDGHQAALGSIIA